MRVVSMTDAHKRLSVLLKTIPDGSIMITRRGKPAGVLISPGEYEHLRQVDAFKQMLDLSHTLNATDLSADELYQTSRCELENGH